jgi:hypothetical protein
VTCQGEIPKFLISLCNALHLNWSIIKNSTEGSSDSSNASKNKHRERLMISFPEDLDSLPDLTAKSPPSAYSNEQTKPAEKRMMYDELSYQPPKM